MGEISLSPRRFSPPSYQSLSASSYLAHLRDYPSLPYCKVNNVTRSWIAAEYHYQRVISRAGSSYLHKIRYYKTDARRILARHYRRFEERSLQCTRTVFRRCLENYALLICNSFSGNFLTRINQEKLIMQYVILSAFRSLLYASIIDLKCKNAFILIRNTDETNCVYKNVE